MKKLYTILTVVFLLATLSIQSQSILLVNDNGYKPKRVDALKTALNNLGLPFTYFNTVEKGASPTADFMDPFDVVIWYTGNDSGGLYLWNAADTVNTELKTYLDNGGMMWLQGLDFLYDLYKGAPDTFQVGDFVYDYLGISTYVAQSKIDDGVYSSGVPFFEVEPGNGIFTLDTLLWTWSTMWHADALIPTDSAKVLYKMGPAEYDLGGYASAIYNENGKAKIMSFATETGKLDAQWRLDTLFAQGLRYFKQFASTSIPVESITLSTTSGKNTIDEKGGTLQFEATVLPDDATNKIVVWSLENNTANATIDQDGLLKATGVSNGNGTVTVVATAADGSGVTASMDITITNQGDPSDYEILLVNDNANGTDRYLVLDTALTNNEYNFAIYNTVLTNTYPDLDYLSSFDVVIWYTGNDGVNLKLWDVSDSTDIKFNAPLKSYLDNGGIVWLQGLDFLYDVYGKAPYPAGDGEFSAGTFIYDYMGIKKYVAQTKADDGGQGVPQLDVVPDNGFCELSPVLWTYSTMWYVDALAITDNAVGIYKLGPTDYVYNPFYAGLFNRNGKSKLMTFTFETARLDSRDNTDELFYEVLEAFRDIVDDVEDPAFENSSISIYPNPVSENIKIDYSLLQNSNVKINITNINGAVIYTQNEGNQYKGQHTSVISLNSLNSGTYFVNIIAGNQAIAKKLIVIK